MRGDWLEIVVDADGADTADTRGHGDPRRAASRNLDQPRRGRGGL